MKASQKGNNNFVGVPEKPWLINTFGTEQPPTTWPGPEVDAEVSVKMKAIEVRTPSKPIYGGLSFWTNPPPPSPAFWGFHVELQGEQVVLGNLPHSFQGSFFPEDLQNPR